MAIDHVRSRVGSSALSWGAAASAVLLGCAAHEGAKAAAPPPAAASAVVPASANASPPAAASSDQPNYGTVEFPVSCTAPAQEQFNRAVGALHSFFYPETVKGFTRVAEIDPGCAMAYWGIAISQTPNPLVPPFAPEAMKRGADAVARGRALARTQRERDWLEALDPFFREADTAPYLARAKLYERAMEQLAKRYPDDLEATVFYGLALLMSADPHDKAYDNQFKAAKLLQKLAPSHPNHPGIVHYVIHAYDYSPIAGQGLAAANEYARIAPSAPHALHMPSHIYSMLGMWKPSIESNRVTLAAARAYAAKNFPGAAHANEPHSLDFMEYAYLQLGMDRQAREIVGQAAAITKTNVMTLTVETGLAAVPVRFALERGAWAEAIALEPRPSPIPYAEAIGHFGRAVGAAKLGDAAHAEQARGAIERMAELRDKYAKPDQKYWAEQTEVLIHGASAWLAHSRKDDTEAVRLLKAAADLEDSSEKHVAMENRLFPMREQLGDLLLELREPEKALAEFEASLKSSPNRLRGLYGAARAAELAGHEGAARSYYEKLRALTADASGQRAEISRARAFLAAAR